MGSQVRGLPPRPVRRALGCGRSSTAEPRAVDLLVPVRLRPVTPKRTRNRTRRELERQSTGLLPRMVRVRAPGDAPAHPSWRNRQTHRSQKPAPTGMSVRLGPRGPRQSGSSTAEQRPHQAKAGGSSPPRTTRNSVSPVDATPRRALLSARSWRVESPPGVATAPSAFQRRQLWRQPTTLPQPSVPTHAALRSAARAAGESAPTRRPAVQVRLTCFAQASARSRLREYLTSFRGFIVAATRSRRGGVSRPKKSCPSGKGPACSAEAGGRIAAGVRSARSPPECSRGCSSGAEQPAFNRQDGVRHPAPAHEIHGV